MGTILEYINSHNEDVFKCYSTKKISLDDNNIDTISAENSDTNTIPIDTKGKFAEYDNRTQWYQSICYPIWEHKDEGMKENENIASISEASGED